MELRKIQKRCKTELKEEEWENGKNMAIERVESGKYLGSIPGKCGK